MAGFYIALSAAFNIGLNGRRSPAGSYPPHVWGICGTHGEIFEWYLRRRHEPERSSYHIGFRVALVHA